ncbi:MAG: YIP1 family protein [Treponema sp.]|nr:YIP1 family protein [Treponema sp.]
MVFFGILIGIIILGAIIYLALDKKSTFKMRLASLGAIALMLITVIICLIFIFTDNTVPVDPSVLIVGAPVEVQEEDGSKILIIIFTVLFFLALFIVIVYLAMKEHKRQEKNKK